MKSAGIAFALPAFFAASLLAACSLPGSTASTVPVVQHMAVSGTYNYSVDLGSSPRDLYFVFTNTDLQQSATKPSVGNVIVDGVALPGPAPQPLADSSDIPLTTMDKIRAFAKTPKSLTKSSANPSIFGPAQPPRADVVGTSTGNFNVAYVALPVPATCRAVVGPISTDQGPRTLNIWVADDCWGASSKKQSVNQTMVDALADKYLKAGASNDIYDWDTGILGPEWGTTSFSELIPFTSEITILLSDIKGDNSDNGGIVGYFDQTNNFVTSFYSDSNQRIMFVIDAVMYANPDVNGYSSTDTLYTGGAWTPTTSYWAGEVFSTLAHEFQHMIQFYQKGIVARAESGLTARSADTWIDEMCAQLVEDLVADKLGVLGPRGVTSAGAGSPNNGNGRIPDFNSMMSLGLTIADGTFYNLINNYSTAYSFGAFLIRNYGGASLVRAIVQASAVDSACITDAVSAFAGRRVTMSELLQKWSVSVLASASTTMPPGYRYNSGTWFVSTAVAGGESYNLGSIDFFNYSTTPTIVTSTGSLPKSGSFNKASSLYYRAASADTGKKSFSVTVPEGVAFSTYIAQ